MATTSTSRSTRDRVYSVLKRFTARPASLATLATRIFGTDSSTTRERVRWHLRVLVNQGIAYRNGRGSYFAA